MPNFNSYDAPPLIPDPAPGVPVGGDVIDPANLPPADPDVVDPVEPLPVRDPLG